MKLNEEEVKEQYVKITFSEDEGSTVDVAADFGHIAYSIGRLLKIMSEQSGISQEECAESVIFANKNTPEPKEG